MKLTSKVNDLAVERDEPNRGERDQHCGTLDRWLKGHWSHCALCHLTFPQQAGYDRHRVGKFENRATGQVNTRRCLTIDELLERGWQLDPDNDVWRVPPPKSETCPDTCACHRSTPAAHTGTPTPAASPPGGGPVLPSD